MWSSATKCSYIIETGLEGAPAFKLESITVDALSSDKLYNFDLHYLEYAEDELNYLPVDIFQTSTLPPAVVGTTNNTNSEITASTYPDPWGVMNTLEPSDKLNFHPSEYYPGQKNRFMTYFIEQFGPDGTFVEKPFEATQFDYDSWAHVNTEYEELKEEYNTLRRVYNDKMQTSRTTEPNEFLEFFEPERANIIPQRPCRPDEPARFLGNWLDPNLRTMRGLERSLPLRPDVGFWPRATVTKNAGILLPVADSAAPTLEASGHVFGNLGQGVETMPGVDNAWSPAEENKEKNHRMIVSIFPNDSTFREPAEDNEIVLEVSMVGWGLYGSDLGPKPEHVSVPEQPNTAYVRPVYITDDSWFGAEADSALYLASASVAALVASMI